MTCEADFLVVYLPGSGRVYITRPQKVRAKLREWKMKYKGKPSGKGNVNYLTWGVPVPRAEFETVVEKTLEFPVWIQRGTRGRLSE